MSQKTMNMCKVHALQAKLSHAANQTLDRKFGALYDKVYREDVLLVAWKQVRANKGIPGIDEQSLAVIEEETGVEAFLSEIRQALHSQTYRPQPAKRCWIDKPGKPEKRPLGIPIIRDRVVMTAAKLVMEPIFETNFLPCSYGSRPKREAPQALREIQRVITFSGRTVVIDADIKGFFDNIPHQKLMILVKRRISDPRLLTLIERWLAVGVLEDGQRIMSEGIGTPQGSPISSLLANIYLHAFDMMWKRSRLPGTLIRYCDDFVILLHPKTDPQWILGDIKKMLGRLELTLHPEKTRVTRAKDGFDFLGLHLRLCEVRKPKAKRRYSCRLWPSNESMHRIKRSIKDVIGRRFGQTLEDVIGLLNPVLRGWDNYHRRSRSEKKRKRGLNNYVYERIRIFLKRKYSDETRGCRRVSGEILARLGLYRFA